VTIEPQDINARAMERYRRCITIELSSDNALHVTLNGVHTINNIDAFAGSMFGIADRSRIVREIVGPIRPGTTYRQFIEQAMKNIGDEIS
jgi:hypothetical protein